MKKILIIDDEPEAIEVVKLMLSSRDYEITGLTEACGATNTIAGLQPDLIIIDWMMPGTNGLELLTAIKSTSGINEIPVIISTGVRTCSEDLKLALETGAADFLKKPLDETELNARVASAVRLYGFMRESRVLQQQIHEKEMEILTAKTRLLQHELSKVDRETVSAAVHLLQRNKLATTLKKEILHSDLNLDDRQKNRMKEIFAHYENMHDSFNWRLVEKRMQELSNDFFTNIHAAYPELTPGEMRLCSYFKAGLTSKEIAILTFSSYEAVRKAVYRIRKKFALSERTDLGFFVQQF
jgi:DNA-binding response OmpR family regulator/DNA-binding CsgD family transcriptional regulator